MELWRRRGVCSALSGPQGRGAALLVAAVFGAAVVRSAGVYLAMLSLALLCVFALRGLGRSVTGAALQAVRDAPLRAAASGLPVGWLKYRAFGESAVLAGLAGGLFAAHKGAVFPSSASVATSVDALLVVLLGGVH